jgi:hypothetical protein
MGETDDFPEPRDAGPDRRDNVASAGLDPDTWDDLEQWRTERRLSRSEGTRKLIREGLYGDNRDPIRLAGVIAGAVWTGAVLTNAPGSAMLVGGAYIGGTLIWASYPNVTDWLR